MYGICHHGVGYLVGCFDRPDDRSPDWHVTESERPNRAEVVEKAERESLTNILATWPGISRQAQKNEVRP